MGVAVSGENAGLSGGTVCRTAGVSTSGNNIVTKTMSAKKKDNKPRKRLNYNPREISGQLLRAKKSRNASIVLTRAKSKLSVLNQAKASGQYKDSEIRNALAHARRMVECSRLKVRNLKEEESLSGRNERDRQIGEQKKRNEVKRRVRRKEQDARVKMALEDSHRALKEKTKKQILMQKRRKHRSDEQGKIMEADFKYLEGQLKDLKSENSSEYDGASLDLSMESAQMAELKMIEQQIQQEVELEVEMEYSADLAAASMPAVEASAPAAAPSGGAESVAIDVSV